MPAIWESAAADELTVTPPAYDQLMPAFRTEAPNGLGPHIHIGHIQLGFSNLFCKRSVELPDGCDPIALSLRNQVQFFLHFGSETNIHDFREVFRDQVIDQDTSLSGGQPFAFAQDVPSLLDGAQDGGIS